MKTEERISNIEKKVNDLINMLTKENKPITQSPEDFLLNILGNNLTVKIDKKYPDTVFYLKDFTLLFYINFSNKLTYICCSNSQIWNPFSDKFNLEYQEIANLIQKSITYYFYRTQNKIETTYIPKAIELSIIDNLNLKKEEDE